MFLDGDGTIHSCPYGVPGDEIYIHGTNITLVVKDIRVEMVQDITEDDAKAEGCQDVVDIVPCLMEYTGPCAARFNFMNLWDSINKKRGFGWDTKPMVWVVDFEVKKLTNEYPM